MVGRNRVTEKAQCTRSGDRLDRAGCHREVREEWRLLDVGRFLLEGVNIARRGRDLVPLRILLGEVDVETAEHLGLEGGLHLVAHLLQRGPDILQKHGGAGLITAERLGRKVDIDTACEGKCDDQRRRHQEVRLDVLMDAGLEIAVTREHGGRDKIVLHNGFLDRRRKRAGVSDTSRAAIADRLKAELVEERRETGFIEIIGHDT